MMSKKQQLATRIAHLQLKLQPLVPLPTGDPHPDFPRTILAYHLLTEEQLDSIASYYHQSTPSIWTYQYPACMNWDKDFLPKRRASQSTQNDEWLEDLIAPKQDQGKRKLSVQVEEVLSDAQRIAIKRRKVGKFIGLRECDTPAEEIEGRLVAAMERAIRLAQEEIRRAEEWELRRSKMA